LPKLKVDCPDCGQAFSADCFHQHLAKCRNLPPAEASAQAKPIKEAARQAAELAAREPEPATVTDPPGGAAPPGEAPTTNPTPEPPPVIEAAPANGPTNPAEDWTAPDPTGTPAAPEPDRAPAGEPEPAAQVRGRPRLDFDEEPEPEADPAPRTADALDMLLGALLILLTLALIPILRRYQTDDREPDPSECTEPTPEGIGGEWN